MQADSIFCSPPWTAEGSQWNARCTYHAEDLQPSGLADLVMAAFRGLRTVSDSQGRNRQQGRLGFFIPQNTTNTSLSKCKTHLMAHLPQAPVHFWWGDTFIDDNDPSSKRGRTVYLTFA